MHKRNNNDDSIIARERHSTFRKTSLRDMRFMDFFVGVLAVFHVSRFANADGANEGMPLGEINHGDVCSETTISHDGQNVFFIHTSDETSLRAFELCAIESAALHNPTKNIHVYSNSLRRSHVELLGKGNVRVVRYSFENVFDRIPVLKEWYASRAWVRGYCLNNLSNALRLALLIIHGGTYFDLDVVSTNALERVGLNAFGVEATKDGSRTTAQRNFCNAALVNWDSDHPFLQLCAAELVRGFGSGSWGQNGPKLVKRVFYDQWVGQSISDEANVTILPSTDYYDVPWFRTADFFASRFSPVGRTLIERTCSTDKDVRPAGVHLWASLTSTQVKFETAWPRSDAALWDIFRTHCPTSASLLPPPRGGTYDSVSPSMPESSNHDRAILNGYESWTIRIVSPQVAEQFYGIKDMEVHVAAKPNRGTWRDTENDACLCIRMGSAHDEKSTKELCVPSRDVFESIDVDSFRRKFPTIDGFVEHHDRLWYEDPSWRIASILWRDFRLDGFLYASAHIERRVDGRCEVRDDGIALSRVRHATWSSDFIAWKAKKQEEMCSKLYGSGPPV